MEFVINSITSPDRSDIDIWFNKYVYKQSQLYKNYIKSRNNNNTYAELSITNHLQIWVDKLSRSVISVEPIDKTVCIPNKKKKYRVYADSIPLATIELINGKYMYVDIPFQGSTIINKEYMEQFY